MGDLLAATESAIKAAEHLTPADDGAVEALRMLARKIDAWDVIVSWALDDVADREGGRPVVPANDNVSLPSYLKYCESLGLTPAGRRQQPKEPASDKFSSGVSDRRRAARQRRAT